MVGDEVLRSFEGAWSSSFAVVRTLSLVAVQVNPTSTSKQRLIPKRTVPIPVGTPRLRAAWKRDLFLSVIWYKLLFNKRCTFQV